MAVGFPTKANWSAGDVLTASALDDLAGTVNLLSNASATSGSQLVSNAAGTSFAYQATPSASNPLINGAFTVAQRGTSVAIAANAGGYTLDRWYAQSVATGSALTISRQTTNDSTNLPNIQYCARVQRNSGQTATGSILFSQSMESINSIPFAGKVVTMSFYARAGANYSATANALSVYLISGTGTDQLRGAGNSYTGETFPINNQTATLTTTWQRFTFTGTVPATSTELAFYPIFAPTGTAGANDYYEITGCQIDIGTVALPFRTTASTYQGELAACQRYYYRTLATGNFSRFGIGQVTSTTTAYCYVNFPVIMRIAPTSLETTGTPANYALTNAAAGAVALSAGPLFDSANTSGSLLNNAVTAGLIGGNATQFLSNNNTSAYLGWSAEL
jgi:hypothetical protein